MTIVMFASCAKKCDFFEQVVRKGHVQGEKKSEHKALKPWSISLYYDDFNQSKDYIEKEKPKSSSGDMPNEGDDQNPTETPKSSNNSVQAEFTEKAMLNEDLEEKLTPPRIAYIVPEQYHEDFSKKHIHKGRNKIIAKPAQPETYRCDMLNDEPTLVVPENLKVPIFPPISIQTLKISNELLPKTTVVCKRKYNYFQSFDDNQGIKNNMTNYDLRGQNEIAPGFTRKSMLGDESSFHVPEESAEIDTYTPPDTIPQLELNKEFEPKYRLGMPEEERCESSYKSMQAPDFTKDNIHHDAESSFMVPKKTFEPGISYPLFDDISELTLKNEFHKSNRIKDQKSHNNETCIQPVEKVEKQFVPELKKQAMLQEALRNSSHMSNKCNVCARPDIIPNIKNYEQNEFELELYEPEINDTIEEKIVENIIETQNFMKKSVLKDEASFMVPKELPDAGKVIAPIFTHKLKLRKPNAKIVESPKKTHKATKYYAEDANEAINTNKLNTVTSYVKKQPGPNCVVL